MERGTMNLKGKTALITGSSRGIGRTIALKMADLGADIAVNYIDIDDNKKDAESAVAELREKGVKAEMFEADVASLDSVTAMIEAVIKEFGKIDILVNNSGITRDNIILRMKEVEWDSVISVNLKGAFNCTKAVARSMLKNRSGRIINISSVVGLFGNAGQANYSASKAGLIGLTKSSAKEFASRGVTVNAIAPGFIASAMTDALPEKAREELLNLIPLNRIGDPEEVAEAVAFLAGEGASYITGNIVNVNGGMYM